MSAFRFVDPNPVIWGLLGMEIAPGGSLTFYEQGTTTLKDTWSDQALAIENPNPVELDSAGRAETEIWLDGEYTVLAKDSDGTTIWTRDVVPEIAPGLAIPSLVGVSGYFLSNDGTNPIWVPITLLPDPSGSAGYQVVVNSDSTGYILQPIETPDIPDPDIVVTANSFRAGTSDEPTKEFSQRGSGSAAASGTKTTSVAIVFAVPFSTLDYVGISPTAGFVTQAGTVQPSWSVTSMSTTGFTVQFSTQTGEANSDNNIVTPVTFKYLAVGTLEVP